jgi:TATA-binding protein-associated factor
LLSSSGKEYGKLSNLSAEELAKAQKDALGKLGLGFGGAENDIGVDVGAELAADQEGTAAAPPAKVEAPPPRPPLPPPRFALPPPKFKNDPSASTEFSSLRSVAAQASPVASTSSLPTPAPAPAPPVASVSPAPEASAEEEDPYAGLSARERNKLKRKRKTEAKSGGPISAAPPAAKVRVVEAPKETNGAAASPAVAIKKEEPAEPTTGREVVVIDPGAKARERERQGGEVQVDLEAKVRAEMEVKAGEWPWRGTVERLAVALLS